MWRVTTAPQNIAESERCCIHTCVRASACPKVVSGWILRSVWGSRWAFWRPDWAVGVPVGAVFYILGVQIGPLDGCGQILSTEPLRTSFRDEMWTILGPILGSDFTRCAINRESFFAVDVCSALEAEIHKCLCVLLSLRGRF